MFTVGQALVLGLAGTIYVVGAALLLGGQSVLQGQFPSGGEGGQIVRADAVEGRPAYFVPDLAAFPAGPRSLVETSSLDGARAPADGMKTTPRATVRREPFAQKQGTGRAERSGGSPLTAPICMN